MMVISSAALEQGYDFGAMKGAVVPFDDACRAATPDLTRA